jgi:sugar (glycoside-pentoside-hexuronide) transporter
MSEDPAATAEGKATVPATARPISASRKAVFALGDHAVNVSLGALSLVFFIFLVTVPGLEPWRAGVLTWIARLVDAFSDPIMGRISDSTKWRMGRRRPYFLLGMLPLGLCFGLLWQTPFEDQSAMFAYYLATYIGLSLSMTIVSVPYMALIPEMATDYDERTSINTFRSAAAVVGTMVAAMFFSLVEWFGGESRGFAITGTLIAIWLVLPWPFVYKVSFERPTEKRRSEPSTGLLGGLRSLVGHANYIRLCVIYLTARIAADVLGLAVPFFITFWIGRKADVSGTLVCMLGVVVISLPFWLNLARRREKNEIFVIGAAWFAACLSLIWFADPSWPRWMLFAVAGLLGIGYAVVDLMPWAMLGEVIDEDELLSGDRREGVYNGVFTFLRKVGGATAAMLAGYSLSAAGFDADIAEQPDSALLTIRLLTTFIPAAFLAIALIVALTYPLGRKRHQEILRLLDGKSEAG